MEPAVDEGNAVVVVDVVVTVGVVAGVDDDGVDAAEDASSTPAPAPAHSSQQGATKEIPKRTRRQGDVQ